LVFFNTLLEQQETACQAGLPISNLMVRNLRSSLGIIEHSCESIHLKGGLDRIARIRPLLALARKTIDPVALAHELRVLRESIEDDLKHRHFLYLHKWDYWHNPGWFGDAVYDRFLDAREDMAAATDGGVGQLVEK
jgi:hypothetical protein